jgi:HEAT repeat protein
LEIVPFNKEQIEAYIKVWHHIFEPNNGLSDFADRLIDELKNKPQIYGLAQNPLLLSFLCLLAKKVNFSLPVRRCNLYENIVDHILGKWSPLRVSQTSERIASKKLFLREIAYYFSCKNSQIFGIEELLLRTNQIIKKHPILSNYSSEDTILTEVIKNDGMLVPIDKDETQYIFLHRTFQEFFTALYLKNISESDQEKAIDLAKERYWDFEWRVTLAILAGLLKDSSPLIQSINSEKDDIFDSLLILSGQCILESAEITGSVVHKIVKNIFSLWENIPLTPIYIYNVFIDLVKTNTLMNELVYKALNKNNLKRRAALILGKIGGKRATEALIEALNDKDKYVKVDVIWALENTGDPEATMAVAKMLYDKDDTVRYCAARTLGIIGDRRAVEALIKVLGVSYYSSETKSMAAETLGKIDDPIAIKPLADVLKSKDFSIAWDIGFRLAAAKALAMISDAQSKRILIDAFRGKDRIVRYLAAKAFWKAGSSELTDASIGALKADHKTIRYWAANFLSEHCIPEATSALIEALDDEDSDVWGKAVDALGKLGTPEATSALIKNFSDKTLFYKKQILEKLGKIGNRSAIKALVETLRNEDHDLGSKAMMILEKIDRIESKKLIIAPQKNTKSDVSLQATIDLVKTNDHRKAIPILIESLKQDNIKIVKQAVNDLGTIGGPRETEALIEILNYDNYSVGFSELNKLKKYTVRSLVIDNLTKIGSKRAIEAFIEALHHEDRSFITPSAAALQKIGNLTTLEKIIKSPLIDIYEHEIFILARSLMLRYGKSNISFLPVYPELIEKYKPKIIKRYKNQGEY